MKTQLYSLIAAGAVAASALALAPTAQAGELGGVDVQKYCANPNSGMSPGQVSTERDPSNAYSWKCVYTGFGFPTKRGVDMNLACSLQYGRGAWAKPLDPHNAYSWRCYR
jgi:hypothetical protein